MLQKRIKKADENIATAYQTRIVAFIDILGFKDIIRESERYPAKLNVIFRALKLLKTFEKPKMWDLSLIEFEEDAQKRGLPQFDIRRFSNCSCFSDSIVVSVEVSDDNINEITSTIVAHIANIGARLLMDGVLLRGALTFGNLIHDNDGIVCGQALIDAYELEENVSVYPRIVLSDKLIAKLNYPCETKWQRYPYHQYVKRFPDGCVGLHQMSYFEVIQSLSEMDPHALKSNLCRVKQAIINGLDNSFQEPSIYKKFEWLRTEYQKLIILCEGAKEPFHELNENISGNNIHYSYTDKFYTKRHHRSTL